VSGSAANEYAVSLLSLKARKGDTAGTRANDTKYSLSLSLNFIFAAHGLKLIEKEESCKKVSYNQYYNKAQVCTYPHKSYDSTLRRCEAMRGAKL
jgi:hypothetical protein